MTPMMTTESIPGSTLRVRVVVLNWNSAELTRRCVASLLATDYPAEALEIVIVDNGSVDGSVPVLRRLFPTIRIIENGANLGFAEGCNRAMRDLGTVDAVALVNNDATVDPGWLRPLVAALDADAGVGAVAPKLLLATEFVTVSVAVDGTGDRARLVSVVDGAFDVTSRTLAGDGVVSVTDKQVPLLLHPEIATAGELHVPVAPGASQLELCFETTRPVGVRCGGEAIEATPTGDGRVAATVAIHGPRHRRINNLGTDLTPWREGYERRFGEADGPLPVEEVPGWCGGGVLLRAEYLRDVGLFDPSFFAYYEDTDLSWRGRRRGWRTVTAPDSVLHHIQGGSGGSSWPGFFFLNYRNWLLTVLRNGGLRDVIAAARNAWHLSWPYARHNVVGPLRRGNRPDLAITRRWVRVAAGVVGGAGDVLTSRRGGRVPGVIATDDVRSPLMPASHARPPAPRPGGPVVCYADVSETLRSGWRAGIQRVVTELIIRLSLIDDDLEIVLIAWDALARSYRRLDRAETERLFAPPPMRNHPPDPVTRSPLKQVVGPLTRLPGPRHVKEEIRRRRAERLRPAGQRDLLLHRFEPGSVLFDVDATWNVVDAERVDLLDQLTSNGVRAVHLVYDLLPCTHPQWFDPNLVRVFDRHVAAHLDHSDLFLAISQHTADELVSYSRASGRPTDPEVRVVRLGGDGGLSVSPGDADPDILGPLTGVRYLLCVGTIEPRKNHTLVLDAFERLSAHHPDLHLVIVGRQGWRIDGVADRLRAHPLLGTRVHWPLAVNDATLDHLYQGAALTVVPSFTEGFGLPVIEALRRGSPVVSSSGGALPEAGGDLVDYVAPDDVDGFVAAIERHLDDDAHHEATRERLAGYRPTTWDDTAAEVARLLIAAGRRSEHPVAVTPS